MRASGLACLIAAATATASCGANFGEFAFDAAYLASQANDIKDCRETYALTGDRFRLQSCESDVRAGTFR